MKLTASNVQSVITDCLFKEEEITDCKTPEGAVIVEGVLAKFGFHPGRLASHKEDIRSMLSELPNNFMSYGGGGGWSFLNACMTKDGDQWGEHRDIEALLVLGIATKQAKTLMPREMWAMFPGGLPYFVVLNTEKP